MEVKEGCQTSEQVTTTISVRGENWPDYSNKQLQSVGGNTKSSL